MHLFPETGFDQSATTSVFLGVLVSWFFTETLGWVFAGLVVPGYLASLFVLDARSASIDVAEAILTYAAARLLGEHLSRTGWTSRAFGRERFLLILVTSVLVRLGVEGVALPRIAPHASWAYSIGLVVVPLLANSCWKTGLLRGLVQRGVPTLAVFLLLKYLLLPHTNLSMGGFTLATENVAARFLASPRAYLVLLCGAVMAATANIRWGWDFGGILIPALLALTLGRPLTLLVTLGEALFLYWIVQVLLVATPLLHWNIEGPRRPVLYFSIDYVLRFAMAGLAPHLMTRLGVNDAMSFGYLLPTLLAVKISELGMPAPVLLPTTGVGAAALATGTLFGFSAEHIEGSAKIDRDSVSRVVEPAPPQTAAAALWLSAQARASRVRGTRLIPAERWVALAEQQLTQPNEKAGEGVARFAEVQRLADDTLLMRERFQTASHRAGDPALLLRPRRAKGARTVLVVPDPLTASATALVAGRLLASGLCDAVVVAGRETSTSGGSRHAFEVAELIARHGSRAAHHRGLVIALREGKKAALRTRRHLPRRPDVVSIWSAVTRAPFPEKRSHRPRGPEDVEIDFPPTLAQDALWEEQPQTSTKSALELRLDDIHCNERATSPESELAMQRLLLRPLLGAEPDARALRTPANVLGYDPPELIRLGQESLLTVLGPRNAAGSLAMVVRHDGKSGLVIEIPHHAVPPLRRLALHLFATLGADQVLLNPCPRSNGAARSTFRSAHIEAVRPGPGSSSRVLLLSSSSRIHEDAEKTRLGTWGDADALASQTEGALRKLGLGSMRAPLDRTARALAGSRAFAGTSLVSLRVPTGMLTADSLASAKATLRFWSGLEVRDAASSAVALELARGLEGAQPAPETLLEEARRAALEHSVAAQHAFEEALLRTGARAAIARSDAGIFLVVAARQTRGLVAASFAIALAQPSLVRAPANVEDFADCATILETGGVCIASRLP